MRAFESIKPYCDGAGLEIETDSDLAERRLMPAGQWLPFDRLMHHHRLSCENWNYKLGGGEPLNDTCHREMRALKKIAKTSFDRPMVAAHGNLIASVSGAINPGVRFEDWRAMKNPHLYALYYKRGQLIGFDDLG